MEHFSWISLIPGLAAFDHTVAATLVALGLIAVAYVARRQLEAAPDPVVPDHGLTARNALETFVESQTEIVKGVLGPHADEYVPVYATFFLFILTANFLGLVPGFSAPTSNFSITFGLGITSFLLFNYYGIRENGLVGYAKHFVGPIWWLFILIVPIELIDVMVRPFSLAVRLAGNMFGDHLVIMNFTDLTKLLIPVPFYLLGWFVCIVQAFVFTLLSLVYAALAVGSHEEHH